MRTRQRLITRDVDCRMVRCEVRGSNWIGSVWALRPEGLMISAADFGYSSCGRSRVSADAMAYRVGARTRVVRTRPRQNSPLIGLPCVGSAVVATCLSQNSDSGGKKRHKPHEGICDTKPVRGAMTQKG